MSGRKERVRRSPSGRRGVALGVLVALAVLAGGLAFGLTRPVTWRASATLVVLPAADLDPDTVAGYYDTLTRPQVVGTLADILRRRLDALPAGDRIEVATVPDTFLISIAATDSTEAAAESRASRAFTEVSPFLDQLSTPFDVSPVSSAQGTAERLGTSLPVLAAAVLLSAVVAGVAVAAAVRTLAPVRQPPDPAPAPAPAPPVPSPTVGTTAPLPLGEPAPVGGGSVLASGGAGWGEQVSQARGG